MDTSTKLSTEPCFKQGSNIPTTVVSSMEVCTMEMAKTLNIDDPQFYFDEGYENTKTYNIVFDQTSTTDRYESLCRKDPKKEIAYPNCVLQYGFGFSAKQEDASKCVPYQCPPGFTPDKDGCIKPDTIPAKSPQSDFCDEKWYDWFMVPNYHLGNKYIKIDDKCYQPCNDGSVPSFGTDPVDGYSPGLGAVDRPEMCANKDTYLGGKYNTPQNYCPISAIKRLSSTRESLKRDYDNAIKNKYTEANETIDPKFKENKIDKTVNKEIDDMMATINSKLDDIYPASQNDIVACRTLITDDRVGEAYKICKTLDENADYYLTSMREDGISLPTAQLKVNLLKKACHSLFCNQNDNPISSVSNNVYIASDGTETILEPDKTFCFPDVADDKKIQTLVQTHNKSGVSKVNLGSSSTSTAPTKTFVDIYKDQTAPIYKDVTDKMVLSVKIIPNIIAIVILIYILYVFFKYTEIGQWLWEKTKEILYNIWAFITCLNVTKSVTTTK